MRTPSLSCRAIASRTRSGLISPLPTSISPSLGPWPTGKGPRPTLVAPNSIRSRLLFKPVIVKISWSSALTLAAFSVPPDLPTNSTQSSRPSSAGLLIDGTLPKSITSFVSRARQHASITSINGRMVSPSNEDLGAR